MEKQNTKVMLASEYPQVKQVLREMLKDDGGGEVVGQAENATTALSLARQLNPDVAIIDPRLPHTVGLDNVPMSRMGGLDAAQAIVAEMPNVRVVLLSNMDIGISDRKLSQSDMVALFSTEDGTWARAQSVATAISPDTTQPKPAGGIDIAVKTSLIPTQEGLSVSDKAILFGGSGIALGWFLILTIVFSPVGLVVATAGGLTLVSGLAGKRISSLWNRFVKAKNS